MFHKGVKAIWESNQFFGSDVGPCDPQIKISFEIFESFGQADLCQMVKGMILVLTREWLSVEEEKL